MLLCGSDDSPRLADRQALPFPDVGPGRPQGEQLPQDVGGRIRRRFEQRVDGEGFVIERQVAAVSLKLRKTPGPMQGAAFVNRRHGSPAG